MTTLGAPHIFPRAFARSFCLIAGLVSLALLQPGFDRQAGGRAGVSSPDLLPAASAPANPSGVPSRRVGFILNLGQRDPAVHFYTAAASGTIYFTSRGLSLGITVPGPSASSVSAIPLEIEFLGSSSEAVPAAVGQPSGFLSEFIGSDPLGWRSGLPVYPEIEYSALYPGIDLAYGGSDAAPAGGIGLKGLYRVSPGADPGQIRWRYSDHWSASLQRSGDLLLSPLGGEARRAGIALVERLPLAWQVGRSGESIPVEAAYRLFADGSLGFSLGVYDPALPLVIDPELDYSTLVGGSGTDEGFDVAIDGARNAIVVGTTISVDFPTESPLGELLVGNRNVVLTKVSGDGLGLEFSTILGGAGDDQGRSISVDSTGEIYVAGTTDSSDFPTTVAPALPEESGQNIFALKVNLTGGQLRYGRVFGGSLTDEARGIFAEDTGSAYIVGVTDSPDFPTFDPFQPVSGGGDTDGFVMKLSPIGDAQVYSSYLGGIGEDEALGIAVDRRGAAYITGRTTSEDFPTQAGADGAGILQPNMAGYQNAFLVKLVPDGGGFHFSTYLGQGEGNAGHDIALDRDGNAYIVGTVDSLEAVGTDGSSDVFVTGVYADGASILYSSTVGGSGDEEGLGIGIDRQGNVYITGETESDDLATSGIIQAAYGGNVDAFLSQFSSEGGLVTTHYIGGGEFDSGRGIAVAGNGDAFIAGVTFSRDFPTFNAFQSTYRGEGDIFVLKIGEVEFIPTPVPTDTPPPPPPPPPPTPTPTAVQNFVQSNTFLYLLLGTTALVFLLIIIDFIIGRIRKRRRRNQNKF